MTRNASLIDLADAVPQYSPVLAEGLSHPRHLTKFHIEKSEIFFKYVERPKLWCPASQVKGFACQIKVNMAFEKLVRFRHQGNACYGNLIKAEQNKYTVRKLKGTLSNGFEAASSEELTVSELLCPIEDTSMIICIGLNYRHHAAEANLPIPTYPVVFTKPSNALGGPHDSISIHKSAQSHLDYEGELTFVTSRDFKNLPEEDFDLSEYVLGYTAGNDLSARNFQLPEASGGQFCYSKSFDGFAPIGHCLVSPALIPDPQALKYVTRVNGEVRQKTGTDDMIWTVKNVLRHLGRGTTVRAGTVVMTGTPSGVGYFQNKFLKHGDLVEVEIEGVAKLANKIYFE